MIHCNAPWVGATFLPDGKYAPCCAYSDRSYDSIQEMTNDVGGKFLWGKIPAGCPNQCPRETYNRFETDYTTHKIKFLDFRNDNLCNMKCRSCGPGFSSAWASEAKMHKIHAHQPIAIAEVDLSECESVYFAGGEPFIMPEVEEFLEKVKSTKGLLKHLGFKNMKSLQDYITDGNFKEFDELRKDAKDFEKKSEDK